VQAYVFHWNTCFTLVVVVVVIIIVVVVAVVKQLSKWVELI
jgi:hypothetical protein